MELINITTTKTAQQRNEHALYTVDYTLTNGTLERVQAAIYEASADLTGEVSPPFIGNITYENGQIYCSLPDGAPVATLMGDFEQFLEKIKSENLAGNKTE
jgi:hypothetical protein